MIFADMYTSVIRKKTGLLFIISEENDSGQQEQFIYFFTEDAVK